MFHVSMEPPSLHLKRRTTIENLRVFPPSMGLNEEIREKYEGV